MGGNDYGPVISHLNRYKHIFKNNNLLVDLSLGLWSAVGSSKLLEALVSCLLGSYFKENFVLTESENH